MVGVKYGSLDSEEEHQSSQDQPGISSFEIRDLTKSSIPSNSSNVIKMAKFIFSTLMLAALMQIGSAWGLPKDALPKSAAAATVLGAVIASGAPLAANAKFDFTGSYSDPNHPNCLREIYATGPKTVVVRGTDGNPGCPADGAGKKWELRGKIKADTILVDFSPKGGPSNLKGKWEPAPTPGIRWPDGNLWAMTDVEI
jgi:hypothetical protein